LTAGDPRAWRSQNPNTAFDRMTRADAEWIARRMASVSLTQLQALVASAGFTRQADADAVLQMLQYRRERLLTAWGLRDLLDAANGG
jgi:hypothetical protein